MTATVLTGEVSEFDSAAGWGTVTGPQGSWWFHCTSLSDGSRRVDVGAEVSYSLAPGHRGRWEATGIVVR